VHSAGHSPRVIQPHVNHSLTATRGKAEDTPTMKYAIARPFHPMPRMRQRGFGAFLALVLVIGMAGAASIFAFYRTDVAAADRGRATVDVLASAKAALIGYAARRGGLTGDARPGELPCPDTDEPGSPNYGLEEASCTTETIGRLPWRTLGIPEPKDTSGETLWYAVAGPFRTKPSNNARINSNTLGNLVVRAPDGTSTLTTAAVAVIFAPGFATGAQSRGSDLAQCATTGTNRRRDRCAANYLDSVTVGAITTNNASNAGPFVAGALTNTFNDNVAFITTAELMPVVETRVGRELKALLLEYRTKSACRCYPWADSWLYSGGIADIHVNRGRFPSQPFPENWGDGAIPGLPQWIAANDWHNLVYYSAARQETDQSGAICLFCSPNQTLTVSGNPVSALIFTPGPPPAGVDRASAGQINNLANYLNDPQNHSGGTCPGWNSEWGGAVQNIAAPVVPATCDTFVQPTGKGLNRDRLYTISTTPASHCATAASTLLNNAPCKDSNAPNSLNPMCVFAAAKLATCSCSAAAQDLLVVPCRNTLNSSNCVAPVQQLQQCQG
jgi:hypothetical protein